MIQMFVYAVLLISAFRLGWGCIKFCEPADDDGAVWARIISIACNIAIILMASRILFTFMGGVYG